MALTNMGDRSRSYMLKKINYSLATIIILHQTLFWSPDNDTKCVPKYQRPNHYSWLTHGIKQVTGAMQNGKLDKVKKYALA